MKLAARLALGAALVAVAGTAVVLSVLHGETRPQVRQSDSSYLTYKVEVVNDKVVAHIYSYLHINLCNFQMLVPKWLTKTSSLCE